MGVVACILGVRSAAAVGPRVAEVAGAGYSRDVSRGVGTGICGG